MVKPDKKLGEKMKALRLEREMTQPQAALMFRISLSTLVRLEMGGGCSDLTRAKIEKVLNQYSVAA